MKGKGTDIQAAKAEVVGDAVCESALAVRLAAQYRRAEGARGAFVREAVAFGAMMIAAERYFVAAATKYKTCRNGVESTESGKKGRWGEGRPDSGIEAWLAERCPEINYGTARGYKAMAVKVVAMMGGMTAEVLAALRSPHELAISYEPSGAAEPFADDVETVSAEVIEARERLFTEATSRRKLEQLWLSFVGRGGAEGEGRGARAAQPLPRLSAQESAKRIWAQVMGVVDKRAVMDAVALLPPKVAESCHGRLFELTKLLREQMGVGE